MIYRFKSKAGADVIMMGANGEQVLRLLGREPAAEGLLPVDQLVAAINALEQAVAEDEARFAQAQTEAEAAGEPAPKREGVTLRQRAWPLIELMRHSIAGKADCFWTAK